MRDERLKISRRGFLRSMGALTCLSPLCSTVAGMTTKTNKQDRWLQTGDAVAGLECFDQAMKKFMQDRAIPGGSLAVTCNQRLVLARGYSTMNEADAVLPNSVFRVASLTKPITAAAILKLIEEKKLSLSDKIVDVLPEKVIGCEFADSRTREITIVHLLQHLGGWCRELSFDAMFRDHEIAKELKVSLPVSKQDIIHYMNSKPLQYQPGTKYSYSNYGYMLLGLAIETITGQSYGQFVKTSILEPLGMKSAKLGRTQAKYRLKNEVKYYSSYQGLSVLDDNPVIVPLQYGGFNIENMDAHGGWVMSAIDMVRFSSAFDDPCKCPILSKASIDTMFRLPGYLSKQEQQPDEAYYGCGWSILSLGNGTYNASHFGSLPGSHTLLVRRNNCNLNWCVLFNQRADASGLGYREIDIILNNAADSVKRWPDHDLF